MGDRAKRWREPKARPGELIARFGRVDGDLDIAYAWGAGGASKADARVLSEALERVFVFDDKSLRQVLIDRGYDITTLRFSVRQHPPLPDAKRIEDKVRV